MLAASVTLFNCGGASSFITGVVAVEGAFLLPRFLLIAAALVDVGVAGLFGVFGVAGTDVEFFLALLTFFLELLIFPGGIGLIGTEPDKGVGAAVLGAVAVVFLIAGDLIEGDMA